MNKVDAKVGEDEEERELEEIVPSSRSFSKGVVELGVSPNLGEEEGYREDRDPRHGANSLSDLHSYLVLEKFRVLENRFIEDKDVGQGGDDKVDRCAHDPGRGDELPSHQ